MAWWWYPIIYVVGWVTSGCFAIWLYGDEELKKGEDYWVAVAFFWPLIVAFALVVLGLSPIWGPPAAVKKYRQRSLARREQREKEISPIILEIEKELAHGEQHPA